MGSGAALLGGRSITARQLAARATERIGRSPHFLRDRGPPATWTQGQGGVVDRRQLTKRNHRPADPGKLRASARGSILSAADHNHKKASHLTHTPDCTNHGLRSTHTHTPDYTNHGLRISTRVVHSRRNARFYKGTRCFLALVEHEKELYPASVYRNGRLKLFRLLFAIPTERLHLPT